MGTKHLFGIEWDHELEEGIFSNLRDDTLIEIIPENFFGGRFSESLNRLSEMNVPVSVHGVLLSIGSMQEMEIEHLQKVSEIARQVPMIGFSEHLALTKVAEIDLDALTPLQWSREVADAVCRKIETIQKIFDVPFSIENVANRFIVPGSEMSESEFINYILKNTGCDLLLDLHNVHVNAANFGFDAYQWLNDIDLKKVSLVHLAGGYKDPDGFLMDSHDNAVPEEVWALYRYVAERAETFDTVIERTSSLPDYALLDLELDRARDIVSEFSYRYRSASLSQEERQHL